MKRFLPCIVIGLTGLLGCDTERAAKPLDAAPAVAMPHGFKAKCLTCGDHEFDVQANTARTDFKGATYYFCTPDCKTEFLSDPDTYVKKATPATAPASQPTTRST